MANEYQPVDLDQLELEQGDDAQVPLFRLNGKEYCIPAKPRANIALRYLYDVRRQGDDIAASRLLESLLGEEGFTALMEYDDLSLEQLQSVMVAAQQVVMGAVEQGNA